jgi:hypothetical protein
LARRKCVGRRAHVYDIYPGKWIIAGMTPTQAAEAVRQRWQDESFAAVKSQTGILPF